MTSKSQDRAQRKRRRTWPSFPAKQLSPILESPQISSPNLWDDTSNLDSLEGRMLSYSRQLAQCKQELQRFRLRNTELESICISQAKLNLSLTDQVHTWQNKYNRIEIELIDAAQEIEQARMYVGSVELANAKLKYALATAQERTQTKRRSWKDKFFRLCGGSDQPNSKSELMNCYHRKVENRRRSDRSNPQTVPLSHNENGKLVSILVSNDEKRRPEVTSLAKESDSCRPIKPGELKRRRRRSISERSKELDLER